MASNGAIAAVGAGTLSAGLHSLRVDTSDAAGPHDSSYELADPQEAEICQVVWGVESQLRSSPGAEPQLRWRAATGREHSLGLLDGFDPSEPAQQEELRLACLLIMHAHLRRRHSF